MHSNAIKNGVRKAKQRRLLDDDDPTSAECLETPKMPRFKEKGSVQKKKVIKFSMEDESEGRRPPEVSVNELLLTLIIFVNCPTCLYHNSKKRAR